MDLKSEFIEIFKKYRHKNNLTQSDIAKMTGIHQQAISRFESGNIDVRLSFIEKLFSILNIKCNITLDEYKYFYINDNHFIYDKNIYFS